MIGYAEKEIFTNREQVLLVRATNLVERVPYSFEDGEPIRCHELARAVGQALELEYEDGHYGFVEHTWLWTSPFDGKTARWSMPNVLDVYVPGGLPQVQLVHMGSTGPPTRYFLAVVIGLEIRQPVVERLLGIMRGVKF